MKQNKKQHLYKTTPVKVQIHIIKLKKYFPMMKMKEENGNTMAQ